MTTDGEDTRKLLDISKVAINMQDRLATMDTVRQKLIDKLMNVVDNTNVNPHDKSYDLLAKLEIFNTLDKQITGIENQHLKHVKTLASLKALETNENVASVIADTLKSINLYTDTDVDMANISRDTDIEEITNKNNIVVSEGELRMDPLDVDNIQIDTDTDIEDDNTDID